MECKPFCLQKFNQLEYGELLTGNLFSSTFHFDHGHPFSLIRVFDWHSMGRKGTKLLNAEI